MYHRGASDALPHRVRDTPVRRRTLRVDLRRRPQTARINNTRVVFFFSSVIFFFFYFYYFFFDGADPTRDAAGRVQRLRVCDFVSITYMVSENGTRNKIERDSEKKKYYLKKKKLV